MSLFSTALQSADEERWKGGGHRHGARKGIKHAHKPKTLAPHVKMPHVKKPSVKSHGLAVYGAKHKVVTNLIRGIIAEEERREYNRDSRGRFAAGDHAGRATYHAERAGKTTGDIATLHSRLFGLHTQALEAKGKSKSAIIQKIKEAQAQLKVTAPKELPVITKTATKTSSQESSKLPAALSDGRQVSVTYDPGNTPDEIHAASQSLLGRILSNREIAGLVGAQDGATVQISASRPGAPPWLWVYIRGKGYAAERIIRQRDGRTTLINDALKITQTGTGLGARILADQVAAASHLGFPAISTYAAGNASDPEHNGYYTWARLGYNAPLSSISGLPALPKYLQGAQTVHDIMKTARGAAWWKKNGQEFSGTFDLTSGSTSMRVLSAYLKQKGVQHDLTTRAMQIDPEQTRGREEIEWTEEDEDAADWAWEEIAEEEATTNTKQSSLTSLIRSLIAEEQRDSESWKRWHMMHPYVAVGRNPISLAHAKAGASGKGGTTSGTKAAEHPGMHALRQSIASLRATHAEAIASDKSGKLDKALTALEKSAQPKTGTGTKGTAGTKNLEGIIKANNELTPINTNFESSSFLDRLYGNAVDLGFLHQLYGTGQLKQAISRYGTSSLRETAKATGVTIPKGSTRDDILQALVSHQLAKDGIVTAPGVAPTKAEQTLYQKALSAQSKTSGGTKSGPVESLPQPIAQLTWDYAPDPSAPPNTAYLSQGFGWNAIPVLLANTNRDRLLQSVEMVESRHGVTMPGKASATRASLINWLTDQARQGHTNDANGNGIIPPTNPKYPVPAPLSSKATKAGAKGSTAGLQGAPERLRPNTPPDMASLQQLYSGAALSSHLGKYDAASLRKTITTVQKAHPGTKPASTKKTDLVAYLMQYGTSTGRMQAPLDYWLAHL